MISINARGAGVEEIGEVVGNIREARWARDQVEAETGHRCGLYASSIRHDGDQQRPMERAVAAIRPHVDDHYWLPLYGQAGLTAGARGQSAARRYRDAVRGVHRVFVRVCECFDRPFETRPRGAPQGEASR